MEKTKYLRVDKLHDFMSEIKDENLIMSNITHYKTVTLTNRYMVDHYFEEYFEDVNNLRQKYKNRQNIEGYIISMQVSEVLILKANRSKLREYVEETISLITNVDKVERLRYTVSYYRTRGGTYYLNIYCIDRLIYENAKIEKTEKTIWVNKNTGKKVHKSYKNAVEKVVTEEKEIKYSSKIRFKLVHQNNPKLFNEMIDTFKEVLTKLEIRLFATHIYYKFDKKYSKKQIVKDGRKMYVNDHDNQYEGIFKDYKRRAIKMYNMFVNAANTANIDVTVVDVDEVKSEITNLGIKYKYNILKYERAMLDMIDLALSGDLELYFSKK